MKKIRIPLIGLLTVLCVLCSAMPVGAANFDVGFTPKTEAIELVNLDTGTVVYEKNADKKMEPASVTKIMTYIVTCDHVKDLKNETTTVSKEVYNSLLGTGSSMSGVMVGEKLTIYQLLNLMMVPSGNDAAMVLAEYVGDGSIEKFVGLMNQKAKELGCTNTHFMNPHGLHDANHYTTANDLYKIVRYAMKLPYFMEITNQLYYTLPATNKCKTPRTVYTTNRMLSANIDNGYYYYPNARGIKTGSHDEAGYCLVSTAVKGSGYSYLCIALGYPEIDKNGKQNPHGEMLESRKLYQWAFSNLRLKTVVTAGDVKGEVGLKYAWNKDRLQVVSQKTFSTILPKSVEASSVVVTPHLPKSIDAPVKKGQVIGTATLSYAGQKLTDVKLVAAESVERSEMLHTLQQAKNVVTSKWFMAIVAIIVVLLVVYIILAIIYNRKKRRLHKVKKYRKM